MINDWGDDISKFITLANQNNVRMVMVGGGAVNFHGYKRHSADVDFWIETTEDNFKKLIFIFNEMNYEISDFPNEVKEKKQNISVKFSPSSLNLELITNFSTKKSFDQAFNESIETSVKGKLFLRWRVLSYNDLIESKLKAQRPKDLLDIHELQRINGNS